MAISLPILPIFTHNRSARGPGGPNARDASAPGQSTGLGCLDASESKEGGRRGPRPRARRVSTPGRRSVSTWRSPIRRPARRRPGRARGRVRRAGWIYHGIGRGSPSEAYTSSVLESSSSAPEFLTLTAARHSSVVIVCFGSSRSRIFATTADGLVPVLIACNARRVKTLSGI